MKARKIRITNYRGIQEAEIPIGSGGVIAKGRCESGKTSFLDAFRAAMVATGIAPSDIHFGADKAEIVVEVETLRSALRIRRGITKNGNSLVVSNEDGFKLDAPQTRLREMLGGGGFDPLDFFLAKEADRRRVILDATPVKVTEEDVRRWIPQEAEPGAVVSLEGHGIEVLGRLRKWYYDRRTEANKVAKVAGEEAGRAELAAAAHATNRLDGLDSDAIENEAERARGVLLDVQSRQRAAASARDASVEARTRIERMRTEAVVLEASAAKGPTDDEIAAETQEFALAQSRVAELVRELADAEKNLELHRVRLGGLGRSREIATTTMGQAEQLRARAAELEAAITNAAPDVPEDEAEAAQAASVSAETAIATLDRARTEQFARLKAEKYRAEAQAAEELANGLDKIVDVLTNVAPKELAARGNLIPGFDVEAMSLDGVALNTLSGGQKLEFAVKLAKRANPEARILICDGLERLDPERMEAFVKMATADGWQLIASRVEAGEITFEAIEAEG